MARTKLGGISSRRRVCKIGCAKWIPLAFPPYKMMGVFERRNDEVKGQPNKSGHVSDSSFLMALSRLEDADFLFSWKRPSWWDPT
jgi:hypothetical protein